MELDSDLIEKINKIISNMVLTIASAMAEVEQMSIVLCQSDNTTLLTIQLLNEHKPLSGSLMDKLNKKDGIDLNAKNINIYLTSLLLEHYNTKMNCISENNLMEIGLVIT